MHTLINSGEPILQAWRRNYKPVRFYFNSFETILLYVRNAAPTPIKRSKRALKHIRKNLEKSPSFDQLLGDPYEEHLLGRLEEFIAESG